MTDQQTIKEIFERNINTLTHRPARGQLKQTTRARLVDGLRCEIEDGPWKLCADLPAKIGGGETAPNPSVLGRSALASCLTLGIARWSAKLDVPIEALEVQIETNADARGELGMSEEIRPGYSDVRYTVSIKSSAPKEKLAALLEAAERFNPYLDNFGRALSLTRVHRLNGVED